MKSAIVTVGGRARRTTIAASLAAIGLVVGACSIGGSGSPTPTPASSSATPTATADPNLPKLNPTGWKPDVYSALVKTIDAGAYTGRYAIFDFDNTSQARDVTESALGQAKVSNFPAPGSIPSVFATPIGNGKTTVRITDGLPEYYDALASLGGEGFSYQDKYGQAESDLWPGLAFTGLTVDDYVNTVSQAYDNGIALEDLKTGKETEVGGVGRAFVYPQMADLYGYLNSRGYNTYVVSAGITWGVRFMVKNALNPVIKAKYGAAAELPLNHVIGISTLLRDKTTGEVWTDAGIRNTPSASGILNLDPTAMKNFKILGQPDPPVSWGGGKVAAILQGITRDRPYLVGGDALGDHEMLNTAENRLWISRLDKPTYQVEIAEQIKIDQPGNWLLQPTISSAPVGFASTMCHLRTRAGMTPEMQKTVDESAATLAATGQFNGFNDCTANAAPSTSTAQ